MTKNQKNLTIGAAVLVLSFLSFMAFSRKPKKKKVDIIVDEPKGSFDMPAFVLSKEGTRLRKEASTDSNILKTYQVAGTQLVVLNDTTKSDGLWFEVVDVNGNQGWVRSDVVDYIKEEIQQQPATDMSLSEFERISGFGDY